MSGGYTYNQRRALRNDPHSAYNSIARRNAAYREEMEGGGSGQQEFGAMGNQMMPFWFSGQQGGQNTPSFWNDFFTGRNIGAVNSFAPAMQGAMGQIGDVLQGNANRLSANRMAQSQYGLQQQALQNQYDLQNRYMDLMEKSLGSQEGLYDRWLTNKQQTAQGILGLYNGSAQPQGATQPGESPFAANQPRKPSVTLTSPFSTTGNRSARSALTATSPGGAPGRPQTAIPQVAFNSGQAQAPKAMQWAGGGMGGGGASPRVAPVGADMGISRTGFWGPQQESEARAQLANVSPQGIPWQGVSAQGQNSPFNDFMAAMSSNLLANLGRKGSKAQASHDLESATASSSVRNAVQTILDKLYAQRLEDALAGAQLQNRMGSMYADSFLG